MHIYRLMHIFQMYEHIHENDKHRPNKPAAFREKEQKTKKGRRGPQMYLCRFSFYKGKRIS